jgi:hypothetical protein
LESRVGDERDQQVVDRDDARQLVLFGGTGAGAGTTVTEVRYRRTL